MTNKKIIIPPPPKQPTMPKITLPFNGQSVSAESYSFSFACFDRSHELFNMGDNSASGIIPANWFLDCLDCLKSVCNMTVSEMRKSMHDLHPVDWTHANTSAPSEDQQCEYWQFRINKSKGRIIGIPIDGVFYIVWLDPHHNLTNSEGYGTATYYKAGRSLYELQEEEICRLREENERINKELTAASELIDEFTKQG